ncbi:alkaline phosphatase family protein [Edaphobacter albus]|uniref:alkaline phosphatase family protein n=1 Tax=Edaphobacter sp. 4G125 TaxID=2763071 RepID=UPI00164771E9|nr:alkaline phosphatase family protein [Edaphobacter sp. 4G125]QNI35647.1 alkaline phosphatase family protein [Edaphobacter sp. 4G125]
MRMRKIASALFSLALLVPGTTRGYADAYHAKPKLVVILVIDQFRGDYLDRYRDDFKTPNGFNLFLKKGVHFTDCYYDYANLVTAAGHTTIGTGSYTDGHKIPLNEWWEKGPDGRLRLVSSVSDDRYKLVGVPAGGEVSPGASPHREAASTLGDELTLATQGRAKVFGISFKDRAAIMTSGHATKGAFWTDHDSGAFITSTYWMQQLPEWASAFNASDERARIRHAAGVPTGSFYEEVGQKPAAVQYTIDFAKALVKNENLGKNDVTDMLTISISNTDILGHKVGPDSPKQREMIDAVDVSLDDFFTFLDKQVGLQNVVVALTGDHGVAPTMRAANDAQMPSAAIKSAALLKRMEAILDKKWPIENGEKGGEKYILGGEYPYIQLNQDAFEKVHVTELEAETAAAEALNQALQENGSEFAVKSSKPAVPSTRLADPLGVGSVYPVAKMRNGEIPDTELGRRILHSYSPYVGWAIFLNFNAFQFAGSEMGATHYSSFAYDRHVPLDFYGAMFTPGTYHDRVAPVDIAATFASILRVNQPSSVEGRVLTQVMKPDTGTGNIARPVATRKGTEK